MKACRMSPWPDLFSAHGTHASVVPLTPEHESDLAEAAADGDLHKLWYTTVPKPENVRAEITRRLALREAGSMLPFAILDKASGKAVGLSLIHI